jgi:hypothetical protein
MLNKRRARELTASDIVANIGCPAQPCAMCYWSDGGPITTEAHEQVTTSLASIIEERVAASGDPKEPFDLRPQRDVVNRRVWRERVRRILRIGTLLTGEFVVVAASLALAMLAASGSDRFALLWVDLLPMIFLLGIGSQGVYRTYGPASERRSYLRSAVGGVTAVAAFAFLGIIYPDFGLVLKEYLFLAVFMGSGYAAAHHRRTGGGLEHPRPPHRQ